MKREAVPKSRVVAQLLKLGVEPGGALVVHTSFKKAGPVEGGPEGLIEALRTALGPEGTLVMPSFTDEDDEPFDVCRTPCRHLGVVADTFWRLPGVLRSNSPHAFTAAGPKAEEILAPHPVDVPHGLDSPIGRVYELDGQVLLLGVDHDNDTTIHLAENMAGVRYRRRMHVTVFENGKPKPIDYGEVDSCCDNFKLVGGWLAEEGLQRAGTVGSGRVLLARSRDIVRVALERLRENETLFLHELDFDRWCDESWASMAPEVHHAEHKLWAEPPLSSCFT